jgi:hypothetical protein
MNGTGVLKVYLVETKRYAYRLHFKRTKVASWVIDEIRRISPTLIIPIAVEGESEIMEPDSALEVNRDLSDALEALTESPSEDTSSAFRAEYQSHQQEPPEAEIDLGVPIRHSDHPEGAPALEADEIDDEEDTEPNSAEPISAEAARLRTNRYWIPGATTRGSRVRNPPELFTFMHFDQAIKSRPLEAEAALEKEIIACEDKSVWHGVFEEDLTDVQRGLIKKNTKSYLEKFKPSGEFDKVKTRVLMRGDTQTEVGQTEGPVCRVESILTLLNIALVHNLEVIKIDFTSAFLNTPMPKEVQHKWILLDTSVSGMLVKLNPGKWKNYLRSDNKILVEMDKLIYGYREAAYYWYQELTKMFIQGGYKVCMKDKCVTILREGGLLCMCATTIDDLVVVISRDISWRKRLTDLCKNSFGGYTLEEGKTLNIIGMSVELDYDAHSATIQQRHFVAKLIESTGTTKRAVSPALDQLFEDDPNSPLLKDQLQFLSVNASCMFGAKRTYPEILPETTYLASKYYKATEADWIKLRRVVEYMNYDKEAHCLFLRPKSLKIIASADASYAEHDDAKSHSGGCIGFEGFNGQVSWFIFYSRKQSVVAKSSCEAELIAQCSIADYVVWLRDLLQELGMDTNTPAVIHQDNQSTIRLGQQGTGSFKRAKHIKVRYFWVKELIDQGVAMFQYTHTSEMVSDMLTKPVTGYKFKYLLAKLLGYIMRRIQLSDTRT